MIHLNLQLISFSSKRPDCALVPEHIYLWQGCVQVNMNNGCVYHKLDRSSFHVRELEQSIRSCLHRSAIRDCPFTRIVVQLPRVKPRKRPGCQDQMYRLFIDVSSYHCLNVSVTSIHDSREHPFHTTYLQIDDSGIFQKCRVKSSTTAGRRKGPCNKFRHQIGEVDDRLRQDMLALHPMLDSLRRTKYFPKRT